MSTNPCPKCNTANRTSASFCANCGEPLLKGVPDKLNTPPSPSSLAEGVILQGRYRIENELGRGGFGAVYKAWDANLNKACAVKENLSKSPEAQRQFAREATVLASLTHPNLPRVTDHFSIEEQGTYLVMDFVEGEDLGTLILRRGTVPVEQALQWINQIADALIYLHDRKPPVVHRDIKPSNIRITPEGQSVLVDFGLVKLYDPHMHTTVGARAVTPGFAPPEQYGRGKTDARTDVYALGATLYTLLTGQEPLESVTRMAGESIQPVELLNPQVRSNTNRAIEKAMELEPGQRYQSVAEFKTALVSSSARAAHEPVQIHQPRVQPVAQAPVRPRVAAPPKRKSRRNIVIIGLVGMVFLCMAGIGIISIMSVVESNETSQLETSLAEDTLTAISQRRTSTAEVVNATQTANAWVFATETAYVTRTAQAYEAVLGGAKQWTLEMSDSFSDNPHEWATGNRTGDYADMTWAIGDGTYLWEALAFKAFIWWAYPKMSDVNDFYAAVDIYQLYGPDDSEQGIMFRYSDEGSYYLIEINPAQEYAVKYYDSSEWETIQSWGSTHLLKSGQPNRIAVVAQGSQLLFFINDQFALELFDLVGKSGY